MSLRDRPVLAADLAGAVAQAGVDPTLDGRALQDGLRAAIATPYRTPQTVAADLDE